MKDDQTNRGRDTSILGVFLWLLGSQAAWGSTLGAVPGADPYHPPLCFCSSWRDHPSTSMRHRVLSSASRYNLSGQCHISHGLVAVPCSCSWTHTYSESPASALPLVTSCPSGMSTPTQGFFSPWLLLSGFSGSQRQC